MRRHAVIVFLIAGLFLGCDKVDTQQKSSKEKPQSVSEKSENAKEGKKDAPAAETAFKPFYVYSNKGSRGNHYVPSGFMPDGECIEFNDRWQENCQSGKTCIKIKFDIECSREHEEWAGIYWLNPPNNWGSRKGGYNLTGAAKLTFWAKGEVGGEQIEEFTIGGITGDYPDTDTAVIGPVILTSAWKKYTIDLRGKDLSYISGGFAWSTSEEVNPESCTFYLDEVRFE